MRSVIKHSSLELETRLLWLVWWRVFFLLVLVTSSASIDYLFLTISLTPIYYIAGMGVLVSLASRFLLASSSLMRERATKALAWIQLPVDIAISSYLIFATGGANSAFVLLFGLNILLAGILFYTKGAIVGTLLSIVGFLFSSLVGVDFDFSFSSATGPRLIIVSCSLVLVGGLVALLFKNRLELVETLERKSRDLEGLSELQAAIVSHIPSGILLVNRLGEIIFCNDFAESILQNSCIGKNLSTLGLGALSAKDKLSISYISPTGQLLIIVARAVQLNENQKLIIFEDHTDLKRLEEDLRQKDKLAGVGQLAAGLAHEIKNPLASLSGSIQLLHQDSCDDKDGLENSNKKLMEIVLRETDRLDHLLQSFLDYAKPSHLKFGRINFENLIRDSFQFLQNDPRFSEKKMKWSSNLPSERREVECDIDRIKQVIMNLLSNAAAATDETGVLSVQLKDVSSENKSWIRCEVKDNGSGISKANQKRIFEPFFTAKQNGTGLGLALVYQIIQAHNGKLGVESEKNKGSTFWVELPQYQNEVQKPVDSKNRGRAA